MGLGSDGLPEFVDSAGVAGGDVAARDHGVERLRVAAGCGYGGEGEGGGVQLGFVVLAQRVAQGFFCRSGVWQFGNGRFREVVQEEPQFEAGLTQRNLDASLLGLLQRLAKASEMVPAGAVIGVEQ